MPDEISIPAGQPWKFELDEIVEAVEDCRPVRMEQAMHNYFSGTEPRYSSDRAAEGKLYLAELVTCTLYAARRRGFMPMEAEQFRTRAYSLLLSTDDKDTLENGLIVLLRELIHRISILSMDSCSGIVRKAIIAMQMHYMEPSFCLQSLADSMGLNAGYLGRQIQKETGKRFTEHLTSIRIHAAVRLLCRSSEKLSDIALQVGYADAHYFSRVFQKVTGLRPGVARVHWEKEPDNF